jgi:hypothetical protein
MPRLEWMYFGQIPIEVKEVKGPDGTYVKIVEPVSERDDCWTFLRRMFGIKEMI